MRSSTTFINKKSEIKESPDKVVLFSKESRASGENGLRLPGDFSIAEYTNYELPFIEEEMEQIKKYPGYPMDKRYTRNTYVLTFREIFEQLKTYPEAKDFLKQQSIEASIQLSKLNDLQKEGEEIIYKKCSKENEEFWTDMFMGINITPYRERYETIIKRNSLLLLKKQFGNKLNIDKAKQYPITEFLEFKGRITHCIFHNERTPSLYYYPNTNTVYCFSCHAFGDSIKVYQQLNNCTFIEAVKALQK